MLNPIASAVIYLSHGVGGPTVVTEQLLSDESVAKHGWLIFPPREEASVGRVAAFDGKVLHGVVGGAPGRQLVQGKRTTLMFAFWKDVKMRASLTEEKGACRPLPMGKRYTFVKEIARIPTDASPANHVIVVRPDFVQPFFSFCDPSHVGNAMPPYESLFQGL